MNYLPYMFFVEIHSEITAVEMSNSKKSQTDFFTAVKTAITFDLIPN